MPADNRVDVDRVRALPSGTVIGDEAGVRAWADGSALALPLYHHARDRAAVLAQGFEARHEEAQDGVYLMDDPAALADAYAARGGPPIRLYVKVAPHELYRFTDPSSEDCRRVARALRAVGVAKDAFGEPGTVGVALRYAGYAAWSDGWQYAALDPSRIGVVDDTDL